MTEIAQTTAAHIRDMESRRFDAVVAKDFDTFRELCDSHLTYTHSNGARETLDTYLAACRDGFYDYHQVEHPIDEIVVVGDVAIVLGQMRADLTINGLRKQLDNQSIAVWVRRDRHWRLLAFQGTPTSRV